MAEFITIKGFETIVKAIHEIVNGSITDWACDELSNAL